MEKGQCVIVTVVLSPAEPYMSAHTFVCMSQILLHSEHLESPGPWNERIPPVQHWSANFIGCPCPSLAPHCYLTST